MTGISLVLGGGGFKGLAHLGVLTALEGAGVPVERVIGTSAGALIGAAYCSQASAAATHDLVMAFVNSDEFQKHSFAGLPGGVPADSRSLLGRVLTGIKRQVALERMFRRSSAFGGMALRYITRALVPKTDIEALQRPLSVCVLDLRSGEARLLTQGHLGSAVVASSSVPGYFPPVERDGTLLCDPGIVNNMPTDLARRAGAERIVAVDLSSDLPEAVASTDEVVGIDVLFRAQDITTFLGNQRAADHADVVVTPDLSGRNWLDASDLENVVEAGALATRRALPLIHEVLAERPRQAG